MLIEIYNVSCHNVVSMRILSGIQSTGKLHLGNWLGAVSHWVDIQEKGDEVFVLIVDLHAITAPYEANEMKQRVFDLAVELLALGIDPEKSTIFVQSMVREHTELEWYFNGVASYGELSRMTQFKDKSEIQSEITAGLFNYPILQAADILLYSPTHVPVGADQKQHIEFTRNIVDRFHSRFGETFVSPEPLIHDTGSRVMSFAGPSRKMSKSEPKGCLFLSDTEEEIMNKAKSAVTDSESEVRGGEGKPELSNLIEVYSLLSGKKTGEIESEFKNKGYGDFKSALGDVINGALMDYRKKRAELIGNPDHVWEVLHSGADKAREVASKKISEVRKNMGLEY